MKRTFNYTERKKINREDVQLALVRPNEVPEVKVVKLDINRLGLPVTAQVWLEIETGKVGLVRHSLGVVGSLNLGATFAIDEPDLVNLRFRIKIVTYELGSAGKLLAEVDQLSLSNDGSALSLLQVKPSDSLGQRIWKLEITESGPELFINAGVGDWQAVGHSEVFKCLVFPQAVFEIYKWVANYGDFDPGSIEEKWQKLFASSGYDPKLLALREGYQGDYDSYLETSAQEVADAFARSNKALNEFNRERS
jgi:hypothetical protein